MVLEIAGIAGGLAAADLGRIAAALAEPGGKDALAALLARFYRFDPDTRAAILGRLAAAQGLHVVAAAE